MPPVLLEYAEAGILFICLAVACAARRSALRICRWFEAGLARLADRPVTQYTAVAVVPVVLRLLLIPLYPVPAPQVHDDFANLLMAETFLNGRVTNATHPHWRHFESIYIFHEPSYTGIYQPGMGVLLAAGMLLFGHPWAGVLLGLSLTYVASLWMLRGWLPARWALLGAMYLFTRIGLVNYWVNSYVGGSVGAIGGAVVLGALPRLIRRPSIGLSGVFSGGYVLLLASRPYESVVLGIGIVVSWTGWLVRQAGMAAVRRVTGTLVVAAALSVGLFGYYNWRVTGNPAKIPYQHNQALYGTPQPLFFQGPVSPASLPNEQLRDMYEWQRAGYDVRNDARLWPRHVVDRALRGWQFTAGVAMTVCAPALAAVWRRRKGRRALRFLFAACGAVVLATWVYGFWNPHFIAPVLGGIVVLQVLSWRYLRVWRRAPRTGFLLAHCLLAACMFKVAVPIAATAAYRYGPAQVSARFQRLWFVREFLNSPWAMTRQEWMRRLEGSGERHLVFVRYAPGHDMVEEWVYNRPDIDNAGVVWAREVSPDADSDLLRYFGNRSAWVLEPDLDASTLRPHPLAPSPSPGALRLQLSGQVP